MTVQQVAALAKLAISPEDEERMEAEFAQMLAFVQQMQTADAPVAVQPANAQGLRPDVPSPCLDRQEVLSLAPEQKDDYISVPQSFD